VRISSLLYVTMELEWSRLGWPVMMHQELFSLALLAALAALV